MSAIIEPIQSLRRIDLLGTADLLERAEIENIAADSFGGGRLPARHRSDVSRARRLQGPATTSSSAAPTHRRQDRRDAGHGNFGDEANAKPLDASPIGVWSDGNFEFPDRRQRRCQRFIAAPTTPATPGAVLGLRFRDRPEIRVDGTRLIDTGGINAKSGDYYGFDAAANIENFYLGGEYMNFTPTVSPRARAPPTIQPSRAGFVEGTWVLTGETRAVLAERDEQ